MWLLLIIPVVESLFFVLFYSIPLILGWSLISGGEIHWYGLFMLMLFTYATGALGVAIRDAATTGDITTFIESLGERLALTTLTVELAPLEAEASKMKKFDRWRLNFVLNKMKGKVYLVHQTSFESGKFVPGLNTFATRTEGFVFLRDAPSRLIQSRNDLFQLLHELGHCHAANVSIFGRYRRELCFLIVPFSLFIWSIGGWQNIFSGKLGITLLCISALFCLLLRATDRLQAEMHADNFGLRLFFGLFNYEAVEMTVFSNLVLPTDINLHKLQQQKRQELFDLSISLIPEIGFVRDGTMQTGVPLKIRIAQVILMGSLSAIYLWHKDLTEFPWDFAWAMVVVAIIATLWASIRRFQLHIRLIDFVDETYELRLGMGGTLKSQGKTDWYSPSWDWAGFLPVLRKRRLAVRTRAP